MSDNNEARSPNNFQMIMQVLARKGIFVAEPADCSLTETVLIQTTPLKMVRNYRPSNEQMNE